jgi:hypothetical protein
MLGFASKPIHVLPPSDASKTPPPRYYPSLVDGVCHEFSLLHILRFSTNAVVINPNAVTHLIKQFRRVFLYCTNKVAIINVTLLESNLTE